MPVHQELDASLKVLQFYEIGEGDDFVDWYTLANDGRRHHPYLKPAMYYGRGTTGAHRGVVVKNTIHCQAITPSVHVILKGCWKFLQRKRPWDP
jgi:hypothetical protein